jgi:hypothetical protein
MRWIVTSVLAAALGAGFAVTPAAGQFRPKGGLVFPRKGPAGREATQFQRQLEKFQRMTPQQRRRALNALPPERREMFERRLEEYRSLEPEERQRLARQLDNFRQLPPERQKAIRQMRRKLADMPAARRRMMAGEIQELRGLDEEARRERLNSAEVKERFSEEEREMLQDLSSVLEPDD